MHSPDCESEVGVGLTAGAARQVGPPDPTSHVSLLRYRENRTQEGWVQHGSGDPCTVRGLAERRRCTRRPHSGRSRPSPGGPLC